MSKKMLQTLALALPALTAAYFAAPYALAQSNSAFRMPSGNIACAVFDNTLRCDLRENQAKLPPQPASCDLDWGNAFEMGVKAKPGRICHGDTVFGDYPVLGYGKTWKHKGFVCVSEAKGLTCKNATKRGWFLNKVEQKLF